MSGWIPSGREARGRGGGKKKKKKKKKTPRVDVLELFLCQMVLEEDMFPIGISGCP